jgi:hypothetical protein
LSSSPVHSYATGKNGNAVPLHSRRKKKCRRKKKGQSEAAKHWSLQGEIRVVQATKKEAKSASEKVYNQAKRKLPPCNCL